jgi:hypothetical protein
MSAFIGRLRLSMLYFLFEKLLNLESGDEETFDPFLPWNVKLP